MNYDCFLIAFLLLVGAERWYERRYSQQALRGEREVEWSYKALHGLYIVVFLASAGEYFAVRRGMCWTVSVIGVALVLASMLLRLTAIRTLGRFWSLRVEIRQEHRLVHEGVYQYVRHPAYLAMTVEIVAIPLVAHAYYTVVLALVTFLPLLLVRLRAEEKALVQKLGGVYVAYRQEVGALLPKCSTLHRRRGTSRTGL